MIDNEEKGIYSPQNKEYVNTSELVNLISELNGKSIKVIRKFNWIIVKLFQFKVVNKCLAI